MWEEIWGRGKEYEGKVFLGGHMVLEVGACSRNRLILYCRVFNFYYRNGY